MSNKTITDRIHSNSIPPASATTSIHIYLIKHNQHVTTDSNLG
jgi:hypothetical protein